MNQKATKRVKVPGVSIWPRRVVITPARASPSWASTVNRSAVSLFGFGLVLLNDSQWRGEEIKLLAQTIQ